MDQGKILASGWRANLGIALLMGKVASSYICFFPSNLLHQLSQHGMRCQLNGKKRKGLKKALLSGEMLCFPRFPFLYSLLHTFECGKILA
jgi:hypothetical protein